MADGNDRRVEAFNRFRDALRQHFIPEATLVKAFNTAWNAALSKPEPHISGREDER